ncbi:MFS transporter prlL [Colletotrichum aenigma]|uniref:MFS transporter prlL n=1 Tax=Colletotrichum aenigma TaxID=1215731 RepID=UPI001872C339|nr:MFS transporter prlL [Colletotrichum aenigma]KAF5528377.1 MFS transporter prlL [Colletotrichum aenigma]
MSRTQEISALSVDEPPSFHLKFRTAIRGEEVSNAFGADEEISRETALTALTAAEERKLIRKVDWRLLPLLSMLYLMKKIDENNASNARIMNKGTNENILTQLGITSDQFGMISILYTVPYILAEIPSNLVLKRISPSRWQSRIMITWGLITAYTSAVTNLAGLYTVRFLLGLAEAGMFPAIILQLTYWLFIVQGALTIVLAFVVWFFLPDFPATTKWLSPTEKAFLQARLPQKSPRAVERNFVSKEILITLRDKRLWLFTLSWALMTTGSSGVKFYQPTIISNMGFSGITTAQILNIPMSVVTIALLLGSGWASNKARIPVPLFPIFSCVITVACYSVLVAYPHDIGVYIAMIIGNAFSIAWFPMMWSWRSQTVNGATGSAFAIGFVNSYGQIGDAIGPQMFQDVYEPRYQLPFGLAMGLVSLCGLTNGYTWWVTRQTERDTRRHKLARLQAKLQNQAVLDDVTDVDLKRDAA